jgi:hypothetical protein
MNCEDIEILLSIEDDLEQDKSQEVAQHLSQCAKCAAFSSDLQKIRTYLHEEFIQMPSDEFFGKTRVLCHARIGRSSIPKFIWIAFGVLLILTGVLMLPLAREIWVDQPLSFPMISVMILLLQNLLMLFFTPVLIQKFRSRKKAPMNDSFNFDKEVCHG